MIFTLRQTDPLLLAVLYAFVIAFLITPFALWAAKRTGLIDLPNAEPHKKHTRPVPIAGGIALFATILLTFGMLNDQFSDETRKLLIPAAIVFAFGLLDDYRPIRPKHKAVAQAAATIVLILLGTQVHVFESLFPLSGTLSWLTKTLDILVTVFWMVFIINAVNLIDSADSLAIGISNVTMIFCILLTMDTGQWEIVYLCGILLGGGIVLSFFNASPAKLFLGDSGAQLIGFFLGVIAILYSPPVKTQTSTWFVPILMLGVPIFDTVLVTYSRWRRKLMFYSSGTDHTYHRLVALRFSPVQAVALIQLAATGLQIFALFLTSKDPLFANILFFVIAAAGVALILLLTEGKRILEPIFNRQGQPPKNE